MQKKRKNDKPTMVASILGQGIDDHEAFKEAMSQASERSTAEADSLIERLTTIFQETDPEGIVAVLCAYGSTQIDRGEDTETSSFLSGIEQFHLELLLELYANFGGGGKASAPVTPQVVEEVLEILKDLGGTFLSFRIRSGLKLDDPNRARDWLLERTRMHTQAIRNWAYFDGIEQTLDRLFGLADEPFQKHHGFSPGDVLSVFRCLMRNSEEAISHRMEVLAKVAIGRRPIDVFRRYYKFVPELEGEPEALLDLIGRDGTRMQALAVVMGHYDLHIPFRMGLSQDRLAAQSKVEQQALGRIIKKFSLTQTTHGEFDLERVFLANRSWERFLIESDIYGILCPIPMAFFSHSFRVLDLLYSEAGRQERLSKIRSEFLEEELEAFGRSAFPSGKVTSGACWKWQGSDYETDLIVQVDKAVLIFEAKSHHLKDAALRGAENALKRNIRQIIGESSKQANRIRDIVALAKGGDRDATGVCQDIGLEVDEATFVIRLSISLEDLSFVNGASGLLKEAGWITEEVEIAPFISIHDLKILGDVLQSEIHLLHYLNERQFVDRFGEVVGDEMDLLGVYIDKLFNFTMPEENSLIILSGMSGVVDRYYLAGDRQPKPKVHPFIRPILKLISDRRRPGWSVFALSLLSAASWEEYDQIASALDDLQRQVKKSGGDLKSNFMLQIQPPLAHRPIVMFCLYREKWREDVKAVMPDLAGAAISEASQTACTVICRDVDKLAAADAFYFLGLFE
tara:strand:- start:381 stop:2603 length:2223 start_codon:yes stop_codon:yes gene_type:complete